MKIEKVKYNKPLRIEVEGVQLKQVVTYKYLGTLVTEDGRDVKEIKARIAMARCVQQFGKGAHRYKLSILSCYVWSVLRYASEAWTINLSLIHI